MRSNAREAVLNVIFSEEFNANPSDVFKKKVYAQFNLTDEDFEFAENLCEKIETNRTELLNKMDDALLHYHVNRLNAMDKSILYIAIAEIMYFDDIPSVVSVSEAVDLARKYSSDTSPDFVNGVLAGIINK